MTKQIKKKNIFQIIADIDAKQENALKKPNKKTNDDTITLSKKTRVILILVALCLPFLAWGLGVLLNPSGWLSDSPSVVISLFIYIPVMFWFFSLPALVLIIYLLIKGKKDAVTILIFAISLIVSLYIMGVVASANESEFTD